VCPFFGVVPCGLGRAAPAVGVQAERPQRSEDERPGRRRGWRDAGCGRGRASVADVWLSGSVFMYAEDQRRGRGFGCRSSLRRADSGMKRCGSGRAGSIKRATTPMSWGSW